jgi:hypothetical protein
MPIHALLTPTTPRADRLPEIRRSPDRSDTPRRHRSRHRSCSDRNIAQPRLPCARSRSDVSSEASSSPFTLDRAGQARLGLERRRRRYRREREAERQQGLAIKAIERFSRHIPRQLDLPLRTRHLRQRLDAAPLPDVLTDQFVLRPAQDRRGEVRHHAEQARMPRRELRFGPRPPQIDEERLLGESPRQRASERGGDVPIEITLRFVPPNLPSIRTMSIWSASPGVRARRRLRDTPIGTAPRPAMRAE